jgi:hypothetical protein
VFQNSGMAQKKAPITLTKEEVKQLSKDLFDFRFSEWVDKNWDNPDAYEYEKTFDIMMKACLHEIMQLTTGPTPKDKNLKKNS